MKEEIGRLSNRGDAGPSGLISNGSGMVGYNETAVDNHLIVAK